MVNKEHLQFVVMMAPTLLLLIAAAVTLASPTKPACRFDSPSLSPGSRLMK